MELGGFIVASTYWLTLQLKDFHTWDEFKALVEHDWGMNRGSQRAWFFATKRRQQETDPAFILRIEPERERLNISEGETLRAFVGQLGYEIQATVH